MGVKVREKVKGSGVWWIFVAHDGKRFSKRVGDKKTANKVAGQFSAKLTLGEDLQPQEKPSIPTVNQYYKHYKRVYLEVAVRETTLAIYETSFEKHILPVLGEKGMDDVTRADIEILVADLVTNLAKPTIRMTLSCLRAMFSHAIEHEIVVKNPVVKTTKMYAQTTAKHEEIEPLTAEEVMKFLRKAKELDVQARTRRKDSMVYYPLLLTAIHTGLRCGELAGLQWGDIDFNGSFLIVRRAFVNGQVVPTKTKKQRRVDLSDAVIHELQAYRRQKQADWLKKGSNEIPVWVFANDEGNPPDMNNVKHRGFKTTLTRAELRQIRFHDLRHTFASLLIQDGQSLAYVKDQLGHSSIKLTVDVYGHLVPGANRQAVNRLPTLDSLHPCCTQAEKSGRKAGRKNPPVESKKTHTHAR